MIKAQATQLISRPVYLQFLAATSLFLGLSPFLHKSLQGQSTFHFASVCEPQVRYFNDILRPTSQERYVAADDDMLPSSHANKFT